jgi:hypothetical protein
MISREDKILKFQIVGLQEQIQLIKNLKIRVVPILILTEIFPSVHETCYL